MKRKTKLAVLASAGLALVSTSAMAQYNDQDLILSFHEVGAVNDFNVDLGQASAFTTSASFNLSALNGADLLSTFGGNLNGVVWSVWGGNSVATGGHASLLWLSNPSSAPFNNPGRTTAASIGSAIGIYGAANIAGPGSVPVAGSTTEFLNLQGNANSFTKYGGYINNTWPSASGSTYIGDGTSAPTQGYLDQVSNASTGAGTLLGDFTFDPTTGSGTWTGAAVAVPEPTTYGLLGGFGLLALALRRQFLSKSV